MSKRPRPSIEELQRLENKLKKMKPKERVEYLKQRQEDELIQMLIREFGGKEVTWYGIQTNKQKLLLSQETSCL